MISEYLTKESYGKGVKEGYNGVPILCKEMQY